MTLCLLLGPHRLPTPSRRFFGPSTDASRRGRFPACAQLSKPGLQQIVVGPRGVAPCKNSANDVDLKRLQPPILLKAEFAAQSATRRSAISSDDDGPVGGRARPHRVRSSGNDGAFVVIHTISGFLWQGPAAQRSLFSATAHRPERALRPFRYPLFSSPWQLPVASMSRR